MENLKVFWSIQGDYKNTKLFLFRSVPPAEYIFSRILSIFKQSTNRQLKNGYQKSQWDDSRILGTGRTTIQTKTNILHTQVA